MTSLAPREIDSTSNMGWLQLTSSTSFPHFGCFDWPSLVPGIIGWPKLPAGSTVWHRVVHGMVWYGMVWYGMEWYGMVGQHDTGNSALVMTSCRPGKVGILRCWGNMELKIRTKQRGFGFWVPRLLYFPISLLWFVMGTLKLVNSPYFFLDF